MPMQMDEVTDQLKTNNMKLKGLVTKVGTHNVCFPLPPQLLHRNADMRVFVRRCAQPGTFAWMWSSSASFWVW